MGEVLDRLVPLLGPLLGVLLGAVLARAGRRGEARRIAAEQLAELPRLVWPTTGREWIELQIQLGRLQVWLRTAGVPRHLIAGLQAAAERHWSAAEEIPERMTGVPDDYYVSDEVAKNLRSWKDAVLDYLDRPWHVFRRRRARRWAKKNAPAIERGAGNGA